MISFKMTYSFFTCLHTETEDDTSSPIMSNSSMMMEDVKDIQTNVGSTNGNCNVCAICGDRATGKHYGGNLIHCSNR